MQADGTPPLHGVVVVSVEQAVAAPLATRHLADLGARVIKVERPGSGDFARGYDAEVRGLSSHFVWLNAGKESVTLDLAGSDGRAMLALLVARADVVVSNLSPGAMGRLNCSLEVFRERDPRLITCEITGYGKGGADEGRKAYDLLMQAEAGLLDVTGTPDTPCKAGIPVADIAAGMYSFSSILAALYQRSQTGHGAALDISLLDCLSEWMGYPYLFASYGGTAPRRSGAHHAVIAPYGPVVAATGAAVYVAVQNDREWRRLCETVFADAALADDPRYATGIQRSQHRDAIDDLLRARLDAIGEADFEQLLDKAGIAHARMSAAADVLTHPQLTARHRIRTVTTPAGDVNMVSPPFQGLDLPTHWSVPGLGEHTNAVTEWVSQRDADQAPDTVTA